jgi:hypothetical protein
MLSRRPRNGPRVPLPARSPRTQNGHWCCFLLVVCGASCYVQSWWPSTCVTWKARSEPSCVVPGQAMHVSGE